ncbi:hypothetical protein Tco_0259964 [Tanacetum coccineum]
MVSYPVIPATETTPPQPARTTLETYVTMGEDIKKLTDAEAEAVHIILTEIDNDIDIQQWMLNIYKPANNNLGTSSNTRYKNVDNSPRTDRRTVNERQTGQYENQRTVIVAGNRESVGNQEMIPATDEDTGPIYDTEPLEKVDSNITLDSSDMSYNEGEVD